MKLTSTKCPAGAFNVGTLVLRLGFGILMIPNGYNKMVNFAEIKKQMLNFLGMGTTASLSLLIFAEFFCVALLILGLFTRLAAVPLIIAMLVALGMAHKWQAFGEGGHAALFAVGYLAIAILGPGKISVDGMLGK